MSNEYVIYMPAGGWGNPPYINHCEVVVTDISPYEDGCIVMTEDEFEAACSEAWVFRYEDVYDVQSSHGMVTLLPPGHPDYMLGYR